MKKSNFNKISDYVNLEATDIRLTELGKSNLESLVIFGQKAQLKILN